MNSKEKCVLRRKRHLLATYVIIDDDVMRELRDHGLMWDALEEQLKADVTDYVRTTRYIDVLVKLSTRGDTFKSLCEFLDSYSRGQAQSSWLANELRSELLAESDHLPVDEYIQKEAEELVHARLGQTRRLSEREKHELEHLIATRTQCTKETWRQSFESSVRQLDEQKALNRKLQEQIDHTTTKLERCIEDHRKRIFHVTSLSTASTSSFFQARSQSLEPETAISVRTPRLLAKPMLSLNENKLRHHSSGDDNLALDTLNHVVDQARTLITTLSVGYEGLCDEKTRALAVISSTQNSISPNSYHHHHEEREQSPKDGKDSKLDREVASIIGVMKESSIKSEARVIELERKTKLLEEKCSELKQQYEDAIKAKNETIRMLNDKLKITERSDVAMEIELRESTEKLQLAHVELKRLKTKLEYLERSRRLGYFNDTSPSGAGGEEITRRAGAGSTDRGRIGTKRGEVGGNNINLPKINIYSSMENMNGHGAIL